MKKTILISIFMIAIIGLLVACTTNPSAKPGSNPPAFPGDGTTLEGDAIKKFDSTSDLKEYLEESSNQNSYDYGMARNTMMFADDMVMEESMVAAAPMADGGAAKSGGSAETYSETNVQVEGVDEADITKNDGKYIYTLVQDKLVIVNAFPAESMDIVSETEFDGTPMNIFVNKDRLVVFTQDYEEAYVFQQYDYLPRPRSVQTTHAYVFDITDRSNPTEVKDFTVNGGYFQARMIGSDVYFIAKETVYYYSNYVGVPMVREAGTRLFEPDIYYFDNPESNYVFHTIASFDINSDSNNINAKSFMLGYSNTLFVSENNMYIAYQKNVPYRYQEEDRENQFFEIVVPELPDDIQSSINNIWTTKQNIPKSERWDSIAAVMEEMYNTMDEDDQEDLVEDISKEIEKYQAKQEAERRKTIIHRIAIDDGDLEWKARGEVSGYLLNQFSMDEHLENLRVATTTYIYGRGSKMYNNVFVLNDDLETIGTLEGLAEDERIYSTRFIGDRLYMVTFKRIDPLFVIDLSNPNKPEVLGELKIPGYSDYLHPYDENHIIGIGKETDSNQWGGVSTGGVKIALFDVSDVTNPKELDTYEIGSSGTDSEALRDHKAVMFDKSRNTLVIPVREVKSTRIYDEVNRYYKRLIWQGAYVLKITPEDGIQKEGKISHSEREEDNSWYWNGPTTVRRSLYMDDTLYTISASFVKANNLDDLEEINTIELPYKEQKYYPEIYW